VGSVVGVPGDPSRAGAVGAKGAWRRQVLRGTRDADVLGAGRRLAALAALPVDRCGRIMAVCGTTAVAAGETGADTGRMSESDFTRDEWRTLKFAPFWMFGAVAGAYRSFDPIEYEAFWRSVELAARAPGKLNREIIDSVMKDFDRLAAEFEVDERSIASGLCQVAAILRKVPIDEADMFRGALVAGIGEGVARARGRFGRVVSEEDAKDIELAAQFLY
jgi:hypothetical protein